MKSYKKRQTIIRSIVNTSEETAASNFNETERTLDVTADLRISARRYGKALETPRCLTANGLLAL
jgi:hypothetical protein